MKKIKSVSVVCAQGGKVYVINDMINNLKIHEFDDLTSSITQDGVIAYIVAKDIKGEIAVEFLNVPLIVEYYEA